MADISFPYTVGEFGRLDITMKDLQDVPEEHRTKIGFYLDSSAKIAKALAYLDSGLMTNSNVNWTRELSLVKTKLEESQMWLRQSFEKTYVHNQYQ